MRFAAIMCIKACITSLMIQIGKYRRGCLLIPYPYIRVVRLVNVSNNPDYLGMWIYCMHIWNDLGYTSLYSWLYNAIPWFYQTNITIVSYLHKINCSINRVNWYTAFVFWILFHLRNIPNHDFQQFSRKQYHG